jgi:RimJ/RimL family protein N-acetyltransferase
MRLGMLETPRLLLRPFTESDAEHLFALDGDPEVMRYIGPFQLSSVDAYRELIRERFLPYYQHEGLGFWPAIEKATGDFIGWFHLRPALDYRFAAEAGYGDGDLDLGYRLKRAAWGKGYATEMARALVQRAPSRVVACALVANRASCRVLEKAGLHRESEWVLPYYDLATLTYAV